MYFFLFLAALAAAIGTFEIMTALIDSRSVEISKIAESYQVIGLEGPTSNRRSSLEAVLLAIWPERFDPRGAKNLVDVVSMLRRAGYPYSTPGDFYASAIRDFVLYLLVGAGLAAALVIFDMAFLLPIVAAVFIFLGLQRPYFRLKRLASQRAQGMTSNMLIGLTVMETLIGSSVSVDESLRAVGNLGGPFCNLMALLLAQKNIKSAAEAVEVVRQHLPDPNNMEVQLFLRDIEMEFNQQGSGRLGESIRALRQSLHRTVIENTETRAALVRQRAGLFGVLAVLGLVLTIVLPYAGVAF